MGMGVAGIIIDSDYISFPHSLLSTSKKNIEKQCKRNLFDLTNMVIQTDAFDQHGDVTSTNGGSVLGAEWLESPDGWNPRDQRSGYHELYHQRWLEHVGTTYSDGHGYQL